MVVFHWQYYVKYDIILYIREMEDIMSKIEKEVKILDIEINQLKNKLESLGATLK